MPAMDRFFGKLIQIRLNLTSCRVVTTTASRINTKDPHRRYENEALLRKLAPDVK
jgi:hypothetical protein